VKSVAAGNDVTPDLVRLAFVREPDRRLHRLEILHADARHLKKQALRRFEYSDLR
jgi:hypothetical protein